MTNTAGLRALKTWLKVNPGHTQAAVARALGVSAPSVSAWLSGYARPDAERRALLLLLAEIPVEAWATAEERRAAKARRARLTAAPVRSPRFLAKRRTRSAGAT